VNTDNTSPHTEASKLYFTNLPTQNNCYISDLCPYTADLVTPCVLADSCRTIKAQSQLIYKFQFRIKVTSKGILLDSTHPTCGSWDVASASCLSPPDHRCYIFGYNHFSNYVWAALHGHSALSSSICGSQLGLPARYSKHGLHHACLSKFEMERLSHRRLQSSEVQ